MRHPTRARATAILWAAVVFPTGCGGKMLGRDTDAGANRTGSIAGSVSGAITSTGTGSGACSPSASGDIGDTSASSDASPDISA
ncbi:MAG TPA: hypothetical protein VGY54_05540, partial [Polyangiaceae bacterium]|nr:hypothetical protein [Polyangiaceae bacterium]